MTHTQLTRVIRPVLYVLLAVFGYWCFNVLSHDIAQMPPLDWSRFSGAIATCTVLSLINYAFRIFRWQYFLRRLGHGFTLATSALYYVAGFAFTLSPGKVGELARIRYYQEHGVPSNTVTAAFFVERLLDLIAVLAMALLVFFQLLAGGHYQSLVLLTSALLCGVVLALAWIPWENLVHKHAILAKVAGTLLQAKALLSPRILLWAAGLSLLAWSAEGIGLGILLEPLRGENATWNIGWTMAAGIYAIAVLAGAVSFLPGGLGGTEAVMTALLHQQGLALGEALLVTLLCRLLTLWLAVLLGWLAIFILRISSSNKSHAPL